MDLTHAYICSSFGVPRTQRLRDNVSTVRDQLITRLSMVIRPTTIGETAQRAGFRQGDVMRNEKESRSIRTLSPGKLVTFHGMLWIVLLVLMWQIVPRFEYIFAVRNIDLPVMTAWTIRLSHYYTVSPPFIAALCAVDLIVLIALCRNPKAALLRRLWLGLMLSVPLGIMAWTVLMVGLPWISLSHSLG